MMIDYRSDTVTRPTRAMLEAMFGARVGDDVFGEDPTVNELEQFAAQLFGMEAALFCTSGTMTNQVAIKCHTQPGDEVICDYLSHIYEYEGGGIAFNSGCQVKTLQGNNGRITAELVEAAVNPHDIHKAPSRLVSIENTSNRGGGSCYQFSELEAIRDVCDKHKLGFHLDGARLFNAMVARKETPVQYGKLFDSISICLSKGLGAPVGSLLLGNKAFIQKARRVRKIFGGGMRQSGFLAAAGLYAVKHHIVRLATDHQHAKQLGELLAQQPYVKSVFPVETNIVIFDLEPGINAAQWVTAVKEHSILGYAIGTQQVRLVTHLDITETMVEKTMEVIKGLKC